MSSHHLRVIVILVAWVVSVLALLVLVTQEITDGVGFGAVLGITGTLTPALLDAVAVERRRRTPGQHAVEDDRT